MNTDLPFGGVGNSGYGRYHGIAGFNQFSNMKSVLKKPALDVFPFNLIYPPYTKDKQNLIITTLDAGVVTQNQIIKWSTALLALTLGLQIIPK